MRLARYRLVKLATADGLCTFHDDVVLGKVFVLDMDSVREVELLNHKHGVRHRKVILHTPDTGHWLPLECLELVTGE